MTTDEGGTTVHEKRESEWDAARKRIADERRRRAKQTEIPPLGKIDPAATPPERPKRPPWVDLTAQEKPLDLEALGIGRRYRGAKTTDFSARDFEGGCAPDWGEPRDLLILGPKSTGKTHLACALAIKWRARVLRASRFSTLIRSTFGGGGDSELSVVELYSERAVLVIDDLTAICATDFALNSLYDLIDDRYWYERPTIVTTFQDGEAVEAFESSIAARLSSYDRVRLVCGDRRKNTGLRRP